MGLNEVLTVILLEENVHLIKEEGYIFRTTKLKYV